jgi:hypothetical protein
MHTAAKRGGSIPVWVDAGAVAEGRAAVQPSVKGLEIAYSVGGRRSRQD